MSLRSRRAGAQVVGLALMLIPVLALAWTPYGGGPAQGDPGSAEQGPPINPGGAPFGCGHGGPMGQSGGLRIDRRATDDAYLLDIQLAGIKPAEVEVRVQGRWVLIARTSSAQSEQEETLSDGRGYRRRFSYSSGSMRRRFMLPPDADGAALQRQDADAAVHIRIPRAKATDPR